MLHLLNEIPSIGLFEILHNLWLSNVGIRHSEIVFDGHCEEDGFLAYKANFSAEVVDIDVSYVNVVDTEWTPSAVIVT